MGKPQNIDEYIASFDEDVQADLRVMREIMRAAMPDAVEKISYGMPTYWNGHNICHFGATKKHIGLYPGPDAIDHFAEELAQYDTDKGTVRIPFGAIDKDLILRIVQWCYTTGHHAQAYEADLSDLKLKPNVAMADHEPLVQITRGFTS